jgi:hypothetical protein
MPRALLCVHGHVLGRMSVHGHAVQNNPLAETARGFFSSRRFGRGF